MVSLSIAHLFSHAAVTRGGAVQGLLLADALQRRGHRVVCFFHAPFVNQEKEFSRTIQPFRGRGLDVRRIDMKNPLNYSCFRRWLETNQVDVVHTHRSLALLFAYFSSLGRATPVLVANRGSTYLLSNPLVRHVYLSQRLGHVIAVAHAVRQTLVEQGVAPHKISVVYGSYDKRRFHPGCSGARIREQFSIGADFPLVVCIAAIDRRKGLHILLRAAAEVIREVPSTRFLVVGRVDDRQCYRRLQRDLVQLGLQRQVIFAGHRNDVAEILSAADLSVSASTEGEGLTGALRESLAMKKPVVCTTVCGNPELIEDGETGWAVPPQDAHALAQALLEALRNPEEARRRATRGFLRVTALCDDETRCRRIEEIYLSLCKR